VLLVLRERTYLKDRFMQSLFNKNSEFSGVTSFFMVRLPHLLHIPHPLIGESSLVSRVPLFTPRALPSSPPASCSQFPFPDWSQSSTITGFFLPLNHLEASPRAPLETVFSFPPFSNTILSSALEESHSRSTLARAVVSDFPFTTS